MTSGALLVRPAPPTSTLTPMAEADSNHPGGDKQAGRTEEEAQSSHAEVIDNSIANVFQEDACGHRSIHSVLFISLPGHDYPCYTHE